MIGTSREGLPQETAIEFVEILNMTEDDLRIGNHRLLSGHAMENDEPIDIALTMQKLAREAVQAIESGIDGEPSLQSVWINLRDYMKKNGLKAELEWYWIQQSPYPEERPKGKSTGPLWTYTGISAHFMEPEIWQPRHWEGQPFLWHLISNLFEWVGLHARPAIGICHLSDCQTAYVKSRTDAKYCSSAHAKTAWAREKRGQEQTV